MVHIVNGMKSIMAVNTTALDLPVSINGTRCTIELTSMIPIMPIDMIRYLRLRKGLYQLV